MLRSLDRDVERQIAILRGSSVRLSLMSVAVPRLPYDVVCCAVQAAAPSDAIGALADHSVGILSLRSVGPDGGVGVEGRFLPRLQSCLTLACSRRRVSAHLLFRAVHRWASELLDAEDLIDILFSVPVRRIPLTPGTAHPLIYQPPLRGSGSGLSAWLRRA